MGHIAEPRKRAAEADARLYDAIENGVADLAVPDDSCSEATNSSLRTRGKGCEAQNTIIKCYGRSRQRRAFSPERCGRRHLCAYRQPHLPGERDHGVSFQRRAHYSASQPE